MIILKNLKKDNNLIKANYCYSAESEDIGTFVYDISRGEYTNIQYNKEDEKSESKYGFGKIVYLLRQMVKYDKYPEEYEYYWY